MVKAFDDLYSAAWRCQSLLDDLFANDSLTDEEAASAAADAYNKVQDGFIEIEQLIRADLTT